MNRFLHLIEDGDLEKTRHMITMALMLNDLDRQMHVSLGSEWKSLSLV